MSEDTVFIDFETAEYLCVLIGQTKFGNQERAAKAAAKLAEAMGSGKMTTSAECFRKR